MLRCAVVRANTVSSLRGELKKRRGRTSISLNRPASWLSSLG